jgi:HPt (histidine-containing phosphotransfer) domain-containing protein
MENETKNTSGTTLDTVLLHLGESFDGDEEFVREVLEEYHQNILELVTQLRTSLDAGDASAVRELAHTIKGSSRTIGAEEIAQSGGELEEMGKSGDLNGSPFIFAALERDVTAFVKDLEQFLRKKAA